MSQSAYNGVDTSDFARDSHVYSSPHYFDEGAVAYYC